MRPGHHASSVAEVFWAFLRLGLTSFGGPVAHLAFFRAEFVERRAWLDERSYADLVALCQFLPGPASSQVGLALGLYRAGPAGALAAFVAFTLPSAAALVAFALGVAHYGTLLPGGVLQGLKLAAVAVVAQAVWGMSRSLCPDPPRAALAMGAALLTLLLPTAWAQVGAIVLCGLLGRAFLRLPPQPAGLALAAGVSRRIAALALCICALGLLVLPWLAAEQGTPVWAAVDSFFRAGALVFGGGHVVLPLLQAELVPVRVSTAEFLAGYGAAQAVPGPLFSFAAYLGAVMLGTGGWLAGVAGGLLALAAIYLPAVLLLVGALPFWDALRRWAGVQSAVAGVNAGVVGILLAALYDPVWTGTVTGRGDFALVLAAFALLVLARWSPVWVVVLAAVAGAALGL
jgi:chromate transporter